MTLDSIDGNVNGSLAILDEVSAYHLHLVWICSKTHPKRGKIHEDYLTVFDAMLAKKKHGDRNDVLVRWLKERFPNKEERDATWDRIESACHDPEKPELNSYLSSNSFFVEEIEEPVPDPPWVEGPSPAVYQGLAGAIVDAIAPHTEADPLAILGCVLGMAGAVLGPGPHVRVEGTNHYANEFMLFVGRTAFGRKGTAIARVRALFKEAFPAWEKCCIASGLSSGEGLIAPVRDRQTRIDKKTGDEVVVHEGVEDKRLHIIEGEFASVIAAWGREGNRLSALLRDAWDHHNLATMTKEPMRATNPHISAIMCVTAEELKQKLRDIDLVNGVMNRFLLFAVRRWQVLPWGGDVPRESWNDLVERLSKALKHGQSLGWSIPLSGAAKPAWERAYRTTLAVEYPGALGHITTRGAPHVLRLALCYTMLDGKQEIGLEHLEAALALWDMSRRCAAFLFGDLTGDPDADKILAALKDAEDGMTQTDISEKVFNRNVPSSRIKASLGMLKQYSLITEAKEIPAKGRPALRYRVRSTNLT